MFEDISNYAQVANVREAIERFLTPFQVRYLHFFGHRVRLNCTMAYQTKIFNFLFLHKKMLSKKSLVHEGRVGPHKIKSSQVEMNHSIK